MKIIEFNGGQGSSEWLEWRLDHVTATDASVIMGKNPFKDIDTLWQEKNRLIKPQQSTEIMKRGNELEPIARNLFIEKTGIEFKPCCVENDDLFWHVSSLDGLDETGKLILEIKCPKIQRHLSGEIAEYYEIQMQHQLFTTKADVVLFCSYHPDDPEKIWIKEIYPNKSIQNEMIEKETYFYENNMCLLEPTQLSWTFKTK